MIQDLHSHTYYSFCSSDVPDATILAAIDSGIELFGICDHSYGIGFGNKELCRLYFEKGDGYHPKYDTAIRRYFDHMTCVKEKYADRINIMRGIEITVPDLFGLKTAFPLGNDVSFFDYCLVESPNLFDNKSIFELAEIFECPMGIAHTDMFAYAKQIGEDPYVLFASMARSGIFWEMNVNYDSTHKFREHKYVKRFFEDAEQQAIIRESGVRVSVGFDGHKVIDYRPDCVIDCCKKLTSLGIKLAFED